jgi:osmoprotectant transport system ATP-binding protein
MAFELRASHFTHRYAQTVALHDVTLVVPAGTLLALVGESGSGKTTLLRAFNRTIEPSPGTVYVDGHDVTTSDVVQLRRRIGYVPQSGGLLPHWTVGRNVALVPSLIQQADPERAARSALERCGLSPGTYYDRYPHELSGGQRQRVAIARALAAQQRAVLLDESFSSLDAISRTELLDTFAAIRAELGFTAILVTHDLGEAVRLADSIAVMRAGRIEQLGTVRDLVDDAATPYVSALVKRARASARLLADA